jgi:hypothetical protein
MTEKFEPSREAVDGEKIGREDRQLADRDVEFLEPHKDDDRKQRAGQHETDAAEEQNDACEKRVFDDGEWRRPAQHRPVRDLNGDDRDQDNENVGVRPRRLPQQKMAVNLPPLPERGRGCNESDDGG